MKQVKQKEVDDYLPTMDITMYIIVVIDITLFIVFLISLYDYISIS
jgi:hypothetical protein